MVEVIKWPAAAIYDNDTEYRRPCMSIAKFRVSRQKAVTSEKGGISDEYKANTFGSTALDSIQKTLSKGV